MTYNIEILRPARKQFQALPEKMQSVISSHIDKLVTNPRPHNSRKLRSADLWRIRIENYRVIYLIIDAQQLVPIVKISSRREDTYKHL